MSYTVMRHECRAPRGSEAGTLAEYIVSIGVGSLIIAAICAFALFSGRGVASFASYADLDLNNRKALNQMAKDFRMCAALTNYSSTSLIFEDFDNTPLTYNYDAGKQKLTRTKGTTSTVLLRNCNRLMFTMNMRNMSNGTFDFYPCTNMVECKAVTVDWACSRSLLGVTNDDLPQTATLVIRNHN